MPTGLCEDSKRKVVGLPMLVSNAMLFQVRIQVLGRLFQMVVWYLCKEQMVDEMSVRDVVR